MKKNFSKHEPQALLTQAENSVKIKEALRK